MSLTNEDQVATSPPSDPAKETGKRTISPSSEDSDGRESKKVRITPELGPKDITVEHDEDVAKEVPESKRKLLPAPFYYYRDFSRVKDPDPLTPLTPPGRVPNFPAKMHAILSRGDLGDVVAWMPHGRSWRVLKPREFELRVIPTYFEHSKFSSFIRQANGWGFRRVTQGRDRNSYYHEMFLRGLPHLCKKMKRPGVAAKRSADAEHEPEFQNISNIHVVPEKAEDDSILLQCTVQGGPKARMPIYSGGFLSADKLKAIQGGMETKPSYYSQEQATMSTFHNTVTASENQVRMQPAPQQVQQQAPTPINPMMFFPQGFIQSNVQQQQPPPQQPQKPPNQVSEMPTMAAFNPAFAGGMPMPPHPPNSAASQFAAGFAAAAALSNNHIRNVLGQAFTSQQQQQPQPNNDQNTKPSR